MSTTFTPPKPSEWEGEASVAPVKASFTPPPVSSWQGVATETKTKTTTPRVGGQKVLDYTNETLSNIPSSAGKFLGNIAQAAAHPIDTAANIGKVVTGTAQRMTPGYVTPDRPGYSEESKAAEKGLKDRYGGVRQIADTIRTDPVGAAADASAVVGGVSGLARGTSALARGASLPRVASTAGKVADTAATVSDALNPMTVPLKAAGAASKGIAQPLVKSALGLPGKTERYGANPAKAVLEETSGVRPSTVRASAVKRIGELNQELERLAAASPNTPDLTAARDLVKQEIMRVAAANGVTGSLDEILSQLTEPRVGFAGSIDYPSGEISARQPALQYLEMKRRIGKDFTKFDAAVPLKNETRKIGNQVYHKMADEFNQAVPGATPINQKIQSLIPAKEGAQRAEESAGVLQKGVNRATAPTGAMVAPLVGAAAGGVPGALAVMTVQEALSSPTVRMALARLLHSGGKVSSAPLTRRAINTLGVEGEMGTPDPRFNLRQ